MNDRHRDGAPLDDLLADLPVGTAPVETMVRDGRARGHRWRVTVLAAVGAAAAVAVITTIDTTDGGSTRQTEPAEPPPFELTASARYIGSDVDVPPGGTARWDPDSRELTYTSRQVWSGSCPPTPSATSVGGLVSLELAFGSERACTDDAQTITADVMGLTDAPLGLKVTEGGQTLTVPVTTVGDTFDVVVETVRDSQGGGVTEIPTGVRLTSYQDSRTPLDPQDPVRPPWRHRWRDLEVDGYTVSAATPPCTRDYGCDGGRTPETGCYTRFVLTSDTVLQIEVLADRSCRIRVVTGTDERPVPLLTSDWRPGQGGDGALAEGILMRDQGDCVYLGDPDSPTRRIVVSWPAGWTASVDSASGLLLRDDRGEVVARDGDLVSVGGGSATRQGGELGECDNRRAREVFTVQSEVEVRPR